MLFTPTLETNDSKSHEPAEELVYSFLFIYFSSYIVLKVVFLWKVYHQSNEKHFNFFKNGKTINVIYEYESISQTINTVSKS